MLDASNLVINTAFNTKIAEVGNEMPNVSRLIRLVSRLILILIQKSEKLKIKSSTEFRKYFKRFCSH